MYPWVAASTVTSWKIFIGTFICLHLAISLGMSWGQVYPSSSLRGKPPQPLNNRALIVSPFETSTGALKQENVDLYVTSNVDNYAFKTNLFSINKVI